MEILYFIMGVLSVVAIAAVVSMFTIKKQLKSEIERMINDSDFELHRRIDGVENNLDRRIDNSDKTTDDLGLKLYDYVDSTNNHIHDELNKLYAYIDSRTDKMSDNIAKHIADINIQINNTTEFIDRMNGSIETIKARLEQLDDRQSYSK
jgi:methyl-accepting chemotaxis protein